MLETRGLGYRRGGQQILSGINLTVEPGHSVAVMGPSGSGKTSLLAILAGLNAPSEGTVLIDGEPLTGFAGRAFTASEIELIRSNPGKVPRYEQLGRWPLRAGQERSAPASRARPGRAAGWPR